MVVNTLWGLYWLPGGIGAPARGPQSPAEKLLVGTFLVVGLCLTLFLFWRIVLQFQQLDQQTRKARRARGDAGAGEGLLAGLASAEDRRALRGKDLRGANLAGVFLQDADLTGADLRGADLRGADLLRAHLAGARLTGARYDHRTRWPDGFDPLRSGGILSE